MDRGYFVDKNKRTLEYIDHCVLLSLELVHQYEDMKYDHPTLDHLLQQLYMDKLRQLDIYELAEQELGKKKMNVTEEINALKNAEKQSLWDCLYEEIENINDLQLILSQVSDMGRIYQLVSEALQLQHVIVYKLFYIKELEKSL